MFWGHYLARGVPVLSGHQVGDEIKEDQQGQVTPDEGRVNKVLRYVEDLFRQDGASSFSSKMALGFLKLKLDSNPEKMARVVAYLIGRYIADLITSFCCLC